MSGRPCIGLLEPHLHMVFAQERVPGEDFVYTPSTEMFNTLEDFCDDQTIQEPRPPLLILGESGSGKSALLANWLQRRQRNMTRSRAADDFVFWHAVGCTRQSMDVNNLMRRLMIDLKNRFELSRDVPLAQSRLSWDLPRFLELASKKGKAIIVIDGLHRLESNEGETNLSWLPLEFPPNVRIILSATSATNSDATSKRSHVIAELERRNLQIVHLRPLDGPMCRNVVDSFIKKTVQAESSSVAGGTFLTDKSAAVTDHSNDIPGFLLFDTQMQDIATHGLANNPLFLRVLLRCLHWAVSRGFSLWHIMDSWLYSVDSIENLYHAILTSLEQGFAATPEVIETARANSVQAGSLAALKALYPWHPSFQKLDEQSNTEMMAIDFQFDNSDGIRTGGGQKGGSGVNVGGGMGMQTTGGQQWLLASQQAESKLEAARVDTQRSMDAMVKRAKRLASEEGLKYVDAFLRIQQEVLEAQQEDDDDSVSLAQDDVEGEMDESIASDTMTKDDDIDSTQDVPLSEEQSVVEETKSLFITETEEEPPSEFEVMVKDLVSRAVTSATRKMETKLGGGFCEGRERASTTIRKGGSAVAELAGIAQKKGNAGRFSSVAVPSGRATIAPLGKQSSLQIVPIQPSTSIPEFDPSSDSNPADRSGRDGPSAEGSPVPVQGKQKERQVLTVENLEERSQASNKSDTNPVIGLDYLPLYLTGGVNTAGFMNILGHALALLYVARHGLNESELFSMLASIPKVNDAAESTSRGRPPITDEMKALISVCYHYREKFRDCWQSNDTLHTNRLSPKKLLVGMQRVNPEFSAHDLDLLLTILDCKPEQKSSSVSSVGNSKTVDYTVLLERISRAERVTKMQEIRKKNAKLTSVDEGSVNDLDDPLFASVPLGEEIDGFYFDETSATETQGSLGPVMEEGLLSALCALGVLHSPKDQVIVLPCENEQLRNVILERYILAKGGTLEEWHLRLIRFFQRKTNSLRRCEELPWHLKICRKWFSLRSVVADLRTFNIMSQGELRDELLGYWFTLTHAPLYVTDKAEQEANNANRMQISESQRILSEIDSASALHLNEKDIKKQLLKDCVANFDIIEELDKTVELWITKNHPSSAKISQTLLHIARFLAEFCRHYEVSPPPFLRLGMEKRFFSMFNIDLEGVYHSSKKGSKTGVQVTPAIGVPSPGGLDTNGDDGNDSSSEQSASETVKPTPIGNNVLALPKQEMHLYQYYRWMWIQFPWLGMPSCSKNLVNMLDSGSAPANPPPADDSTIDKANSTSRSRVGTSANVGIPGQPGSVGEKPPPLQDNSVSTSPSREADPDEARRREVAARSWHAKKQDPSLGRVVSTSASRTAALIKSSMTPCSSLDAIENFGRHTLEMSRSLSQANDGPGKHQAIDKYRYPLGVHLRGVSNIPHSNPSVKSLRKKTLFPSVESIYREKHDKDHASKDPHSVQSAKRFGGQVDDEDKTVSFQDELNRIHVDEKLKALNAKGGSCIPSSSVEGVLAELEIEKVGRLRKAYDKVRELRRQKQLQLDEMKSATSVRDDIDGEVLAAIETADFTMNSLEDRFVALQSALTEAKQLNKGYNKLISFLQVNQPSTETHMQSLEQEVRLAKQQYEDLKAYRAQLYDETDRIEKVSIKSLKDKLQNLKAQRSKVQKRAKEQREELKRLQNLLLDHEEAVEEANNTARMKAQALVGVLNSASNKPSVQFSVPKDSDSRRAQDLVEKNYSNESKSLTIASMVSRSERKPPLVLMSPSAANPSNLGPTAERPIELIETMPIPKKAVKQQEMVTITTGPDPERSSSPVNDTKTALEKLYKHSGTNNADDFIEAFKNSQRLHESMKSHQSLAESRLSQLRGEYNELYSSLGDTIFVSSMDEKAEKTSSSNSEREMRYLDQRLFKAEMRLNHNMRQTEKSVLAINEIRTGVVHIASLLSANENLLQNLPSSSPPVLKSDAGIAKILAWCEERVLAINEALVLDASKPAGIDDSKPLYSRQTELASLIQAMLHKGGPSSAKYKRRMKLAKKGNISKELLTSIEGMSNQDFSQGAAVRVASEADTEKLYAEKVDEALRMLNATAEQQEAAENSVKIEDPTEATLRLVTDAVQSQESSTALRRANKLANRKQGRRAGFGWTIEELLRANVEEETGATHGPSERRQQKKKKYNSQTLSRSEMKQLSNSRTRAHHQETEKKGGAPTSAGGGMLTDRQGADDTQPPLKE